MKRFLFAASFAAALCAAIAASPGTASAGLFGSSKPAATATPSPTPAPIPTATPEPPNIAIPRLEAKLKTNPNDRDSLTALAGQFLGIGHPEAALPVTQRLLQLGDKTAQVFFLDGTAQEALGNLQAATADLEAASNLEPTNLAVLGSLAELYLRQNRMADAERVANRAVTFNKTDSKAYLTLGAVYAAEQKWDDARKQYEQAYTLNTKDVTPLLQVAQTWVSQNTIPNALSTVDRAMAADPKNVQVLVFRADLLAKQNNMSAAASAYDDAIAAATANAEKASIMVRKALMYQQLRQPALAQSTFEDAIKRYPEVSSLHTAYGEYWLQQRNTGKAEAQFRAAIAADKTDANALLDIAQLKLSQNRTSDAIGYLKQLTNVAPSAQSFAMLGQAYVSAHDYSHARDACGKSFQIQRTPDTLGCIAGSDYSLKNYKEAAEIFDILDKNVKQYMDHNPQLLYMAGASYARVKQNGKAVGAYKRLLKIMKPGTKEYKQIQAQISQLSKPSASSKKKHG